MITICFSVQVFCSHYISSLALKINTVLIQVVLRSVTLGDSDPGKLAISWHRASQALQVVKARLQNGEAGRLFSRNLRHYEGLLAGGSGSEASF